jgi:photosystem II stability/assembly factor-like uncharacterized protein
MTTQKRSFIAGGFLKLALPVITAAIFFNGTCQSAWVTEHGPYGGLINSMTIDSAGNIFVATGDSRCNGYSCGRNGIFRSMSGGASWSQANVGLTNVHVNSLAVNDLDQIYAGTYFSGVFKSIDSGNTWSNINNEIMPGGIVDAIAIDSTGTVFAGTRAGQIFRSSEGDSNWEEVFSGTGQSITFLFVDSNNTVFAGGYYNWLQVSQDGGDSWTKNASFGYSFVNSVIETNAGHLLAATYGGVYRSTDGGINWAFSSAGLPYPSRHVDIIFETFSNELIAGVLRQGFYRSLDDGINWSPTSLNSPRLPIIEVKRSPANVLFAATEGGILRSDNNGVTWSYSNEGLTNAIVKALVVSADGSIYAGSGSGVARSTNYGLNWTDNSQGLPKTDGVSALFELPSGNLLAGTESSEVFLSTNLGDSWQTLGVLSGANYPVTGITCDSQGWLFVVAGSGSSGSGAFRSIDNGASWTPINNGFLDTNLQTIIIDENDTLFAGGDGVYRSVDAGASWQMVLESSNGTVWGLSLMPGVIFAATWGGVFHSTDGGTTWDLVPGLPCSSIQSIKTSNTGDAYFGFFHLQPSEGASVAHYKYDAGTFVQVGDVSDDAVCLTPLTLALGPEGRVYAGLSGGSVAIWSQTCKGTAMPWLLLLLSDN